MSMESMASLGLLAWIAIVALTHSALFNDPTYLFAEGRDFYEGPGVSTGQILQARGYLAQDFNVRSQDGYWIRLTRGRNPLIKNGTGGLPGRVPILFIHGILESYNVFVINSFDASPSDLSNMNLNEFNLTNLNARLGDLPSAKSLPLLAMDFGHEVFIMSRRGYPGSQRLSGHSLEGSDHRSAASGPPRARGPISAFLRHFTHYGNLKQDIAFSFDRKFWNFSLDEQAKYDFPVVVDFIRTLTGRDKIAVVGHSAGGSITLQALSMYPQLNDKLSAIIFWAEAFSVGHGDPFNLLTPILPLLQAYIGSVPPAFTTEKIQAFWNGLCATKLMQKTLCESTLNFVIGYGAGHGLARPEFASSLFYPFSSHELAQLVQSALLGGQMHHYTNNLSAALPYNLSAITNTKMSFYAGATDGFVPVSDVRATLPSLKVPYRYHLIEAAVNHNGFFYHTNTSRLVVIPALREIHLLTASPLPNTVAPPIAQTTPKPAENIEPISGNSNSTPVSTG